MRVDYDGIFHTDEVWGIPFLLYGKKTDYLKLFRRMQLKNGLKIIGRN